MVSALGVRMIFAQSARRGPIYRAQGWGEAHADVCPSPPLGAINRAPTAGHRFARLHVSAKIIRTSIALFVVDVIFLFSYALTYTLLLANVNLFKLVVTSVIWSKKTI